LDNPLQNGFFFCIFIEIIKQHNMFKKIKSFFKSLFNSKFQPTIPTNNLAITKEAIRVQNPTNVEETPESNHANEKTTFIYWDGAVEGSPIEAEVILEAPKKKKRKPYKKRNNNNNQPNQVDQLGLPKMKPNDETPRPKSTKRRSRRPNNAQKGNSPSATPQKD
jgi:hypothetical protein